MQYFTTDSSGVDIILIGDETTGKIATIWPGSVPGSYNVVNEIVSVLPGPNGSGSVYQTKIAFFTEVTRSSILPTLQNAQSYLNSF